MIKNLQDIPLDVIVTILVQIRSQRCNTTVFLLKIACDQDPRKKRQRNAEKRKKNKKRKRENAQEQA